MKKKQDIVSYRERVLPKRDQNKNTCLTDCIAFMFAEPPEAVPFFIGYKNWRRVLQNYFKKRGLKIEPVLFRYEYLEDDDRLYLVQGLSPRSKVPHNASARKKRLGIQHAVIYKGKKRYFDPANGKFIKGRPLFLWQITKIE